MSRSYPCHSNATINVPSEEYKYLRKCANAVKGIRDLPAWREYKGDKYPGGKQPYVWLLLIDGRPDIGYCGVDDILETVRGVNAGDVLYWMPITRAPKE